MTILSQPDAPLERWLEAARSRRSRRSYDGQALPDETVRALGDAIEGLGENPYARLSFIPEASESLFRGVVGGYGRISGAPSAFAVIGTADTPFSQAAGGYLGEAMVLEATAIGVGTCWVGGMFNASAVSSHVGLADGERVLAISPLGTPLEQVSSTERIVYRMGKPKARRPVVEIAPGLESGGWPSWARPGVEAARVAPSAYNRQPWRFRADEGSVIVSFDGPDTPVVSKRLDCGIAMLHFEIAVRAAHVSGSWELLHHRSDVARFSLGAE